MKDEPEMAWQKLETRCQLRPMSAAEFDPAADEKDFLFSSETKATMESTYRFLEFSNVYLYLPIGNFKQ